MGDLFDDIAAITYSDSAVFVLWEQVKTKQSQNYTLVALDRCSLKILAVRPLYKDYGSVDPFHSLAYDRSRDALWFEQVGDGAYAFSASTLGSVASIPLEPMGIVAGGTGGSIAADDNGNVLVAGGSNPLLQLAPDTKSANPVTGYDTAVGSIEFTRGHWFYSDEFQLSEVKLGPIKKLALKKPVSASFAQVAFVGSTPFALVKGNTVENLSTGHSDKLAVSLFDVETSGSVLWGVSYDGELVVLTH